MTRISKRIASAVDRKNTLPAVAHHATPKANVRIMGKFSFHRKRIGAKEGRVMSFIPA